MENSIPRGLKKTFDEISLSDPISRKKNMMRTISLMNILIEFNFLTIRVVWCHQHVYEYYHGLKCKKNENANMNIQTIIDTIVSCVQNINNLEKGMEQVVKTTEQTIKNTETINNTLNEMKENQNKTNELIEKRNEKEKTKRLQISECAEDICKILKDDYNVIVKQNTIAKYLRRFDADLKKGKKIALPSYESAMFFNKVFFIVWIRETFAPYYLLHRKIKVKNKTPRCSSSDAAFNEAARQKYEEDEEINDSY